MDYKGLSLKQVRKALLKKVETAFPPIKNKRDKEESIRIFCTVSAEVGHDGNQTVKIYLSAGYGSFSSDLLKFSSDGNSFEDLIARLDFEMSQAKKIFTDDKIIVE